MVNGNSNYERILNKISRSSGVGVNDLEDRIAAKRAKLSGLISKEGAAQVIAAELGVNFDNEVLKIDELLPGMRNVSVVGKVLNISPVRTFTTKKGEESKVVNFWLADSTSNIRVVLWDTNLISMIEEGKVAVGSVIEISNASMRDSELHLGSFSEMKISDEKIDDVVRDKVFHEKNISDFRKGENTGVRAFIVQAFEPRFFYVCPTCNKKAEQEGDDFSCKEHGKVVPEKRAVTNIVLDDGTDTIRAVLFHEMILKAGLTALDDPEKLSIQREDLLGKEMIFSGNVRTNSYFNNDELIIENIKEIELDNIISEMEKKGFS